MHKTSEMSTESFCQKIWSNETLWKTWHIWEDYITFSVILYRLYFLKKKLKLNWGCLACLWWSWHWRAFYLWCIYVEVGSHAWIVCYQLATPHHCNFNKLPLPCVRACGAAVFVNLW